MPGRFLSSSILVVCLLLGTALIIVLSNPGARMIHSTKRSGGTSSSGEGSAPLAVAIGADPRHASKSARPPLLSAKTLIRNKLTQTLIPIVAFEDATVEEALDFLRRSSVQYDPEKDPSLRGLNFVIRREPLEGIALTGTPVGKPRTITWSADNVSLCRALNEVTKQGHMELEVTGHALVLQSKRRD